MTFCCTVMYFVMQLSTHWRSMYVASFCLFARVGYTHLDQHFFMTLQRKVQRKAGRAVGVGWGGGVGQKRQACGILPIQQVVHTLHLRKGYGPVHAPLHPPLQGHLL